MNTTEALTYLDKPVTLIELDNDGHIRQIGTEKHQYFVEWCKKYGVHLVDDFNGGEEVYHQYWVRDLKALSSVHPDAIQITALPESIQEQLDDAWECSDTVYCQVCEDRMPRGTEYECRHLWWVDSKGEYGGCGHYDHDLDATYRDGIFAVLDLTGLPSVLALKESLLAHSYDIDPDCAPIASCEVWYWRNYRSPKDCETRPVRFGHEWEIYLDSDDAQLEPAVIWLRGCLKSSAASSKTFEIPLNPP